MTKIEYLKQLEDELRYKISEQEMYDIMRDYAEYFEEGKKQGKTDKQIIEALGIPYVVAKQILGETTEDVNVAIKKGATNIKSSFNSFKENTKAKYSEHKEKSDEKKAQKEEFKNSQPPKTKPHRDSHWFVDFCSVLLKVILWIFLFIPIIIGFGASGTGLIVGSIVGIGFLSAFSFTVSTYTIFTASLILLCILFGGLTMVFGLIWFIKYLLGISDIKKECSNNGFQNNMNYNNNFAYSGSNPQAYANGNCPNEPFANINNTPQTTDEVPVEDAPIDTDYLSQNPTIDETSEEDR